MTERVAFFVLFFALTSCTELAIGNIVKRVLKVIREVSRGELETENDNRPTPDYSSFDEEEAMSDDDEVNVKGPVANSSLVHSTPTRSEPTTQTSMFRLLGDITTLTTREQKRIRDSYYLKPLIIQEMTEEIIADLDSNDTSSIYKGIADQALDFIRAK